MVQHISIQIINEEHATLTAMLQSLLMMIKRGPLNEPELFFDILRAMLIQGMVVLGGEEVEAAFGASAITGEGPFVGGTLDPIFLAKGFGLGKRVAEKVLTWN